MGQIFVDWLKHRFYADPAYVICKLIALIPSYRGRHRLLSAVGVRIQCGQNVTNHGGFQMLVCRDLVVGHNSTINQNCFIEARFPVVVGSQTMLGSGTQILTLGHDVDSKAFTLKGAGVNICNKVIAFPNATILPGVTIGDGAVVLTRSVVTKNIPPDTIVGGTPAKFIKKRKNRHSHGFNYKTYLSI